MIAVIDSSTAPDDGKKEVDKLIKATAAGCCSVCNENNKAKYKCPRCMRPYCSVSCYQIHNNDDDNDYHNYIEDRNNDDNDHDHGDGHHDNDDENDDGNDDTEHRQTEYLPIKDSRSSEDKR